MIEKIEVHWYKPIFWLSLFLSPLSWLFYLLSTLRHALYRHKVFSVKKTPSPLVVVGNINVGGTGKTPLIEYLLQELAHKNFSVGVISRGYGRVDNLLRLVEKNSTAADVGDEPLLLAKHNVPVAVAADRYAAAQLLLNTYPSLDLILSDDGLQHYRLARDVEIVLVDCLRGFGNKRLLPAGPLREPISRLKKVNAIVLNGSASASLLSQLPKDVPRFTMQLNLGLLYSLNNPKIIKTKEHFSGLKVVALAAIGNPERFFLSLSNMGIELADKLIFADHHMFSAHDLPVDVDAIIVTSKDEVKLREFANDKIWVLPIKAQLTPNLADWLLTKLDIDNGC